MKVALILSSILFTLIQRIYSQSSSDSDGEIKDLITCGSAIKLKLVEGKSSPYVLHSAAFNWGTGSGQQIVSLVRKSEASERTSLWQIREGHEAKYCKNGQPVRCGDTIRLMHVHTKKYLHTHNVPSILSKDSREVSAFANEKIESDKGGDTGDDWTIVCDGKFWMKGVDVKVRHVLTGSYLGSSLGKRFDQSNCPHCPIIGHLEVTGSDKSSTFRVEPQGVFLKFE